MKVGLRADGGHKIGYGHLVRISVLGREMEENGHEVIYFTETVDALKEISGQSLDVKEVTSHKNFLSQLKREKIDAIISDSYDIGKEKQREIRDSVNTYAAISDDTRFSFDCDVLINGNIYARDLEYSWEGERPNFLLGTNYLILRKEFQEIAQEDIQSSELGSVLVMMGGGDSNNFTPKLMKILKDYSLNIEVIIGPGFQNKNQIRELAKESSHFTLHHNPDNIAQIMKSSEIAVSATGTSVYELIATETPFIGIPQTANQGPVANSIEEENLGIIAGEDELEASIHKLISDEELRNSIRTRQRTLIDGQGPQRIRKAIESQI